MKICRLIGGVGTHVINDGGENRRIQELNTQYASKDYSVEQETWVLGASIILKLLPSKLARKSSLLLDVVIDRAQLENERVKIVLLVACATIFPIRL